MMTVFSSALLVATWLAPQQADTTITVPAGSRLVLHSFAGEIVVETWDRDEVRVQAEHGSQQEVRVTRSGNLVEVESESELGIPGIIDYYLTVPAGTDLDLGGVNTDVSVTGTAAQVRVTTVNGSVRVVGGTGRISVESVQGTVAVAGVQASVRARSVAGNVHLQNVVGEVDAQSVSGDVVLREVDSEDVRAASVSGEIFFDGEVRESGRYSFVSHSGRVTLSLPTNLGATVSLAMLSGRVTSSFPEISPDGISRGRRGSFVVGDGRASIEAETFSGDIRLVRHGEVSPPRETDGTV